MKDRLHELLINGLHALFNYRRGTTLYDNQCRRSAENLMDLLNELGITPSQFWDVGANESQVARWLVRRWPELWVISFEPCLDFNPMGYVLRIALSDRDEGLVSMQTTNAHGPACPYVGPHHGEPTIPCVRFDSLNTLGIQPGAVLKVDAENYTLKALRGCGRRLAEFTVVVCEVVNHMPEQPQMIAPEKWAGELHALLAGAGFTNSRVLDAGAFHARRVAHYDVAFWKPA